MARACWSFRVNVRLADYAPSGEVLGHRGNVAKFREAQWPIGYGVGLRIKRSSVQIRP